MRLALSLLAAGAALGLLACGGGGDSGGKSTRTAGTHVTQAPAPAGHRAAGGSTGTSGGSTGTSGGSTGKSTGSTAPPSGARSNSGGTANPEPHGGQIPSVFVEAARICAVGPPAKVAQILGIKSTDPMALATALAKGYKPKLRRAAFRGCLTALK
jgi:hypothetical protein